MESPQPFILGVHTEWLIDISPDALDDVSDLFFFSRILLRLPSTDCVPASKQAPYMLDRKELLSGVPVLCVLFMCCVVLCCVVDVFCLFDFLVPLLLLNVPVLISGFLNDTRNRMGLFYSFFFLIRCLLYVICVMKF